MKIFLSLIIFTLFLTHVNAQNVSVGKNSCPEFRFLKNLQKGNNDEDVRKLQRILNLDNRTRVANTGAGSPGKENKNFGPATTLAVKKFQALFIEYTKVADGKFNQKTREMMNKVCGGSYFSGTGGDLYSIPTSNDKTPPSINISSQLKTDQGVSFFATVSGSEPIKIPQLDKLIIEGGSAHSIRKLSPNSYSFIVMPQIDNLLQLSLQFEADAVEDLAGNKNAEASNIFLVEIIPNASSTASSTATATELFVDTLSDSILRDILKDMPVAKTTDCSSARVDIYDYFNPCYGKSPVANANTNYSPNNPSTISQPPSILMPMLTGLVIAYGLVKLTGGLDALAKLVKGSGGSLVDSGGYGSIPGKCMCKESPFFNQETIGLFKVGGVPYGRYIMTANKTKDGGPFVGKLAETPGIICGKEMTVVKGVEKCVSPELDSVGAQKVMGVIPAKPAFSWEIAI